MTHSPFDQLFKGTCVLVEECNPSALENPEDHLLPEERKQIVRAVEKRRLEFAASRLLARRVLQRMGRPPAEITSSKSRAPIWPQGVVGSITHTRNFVAVALAEASDVRSVGIDAEERRPIKENLWKRICSESELRELERDKANMAERVGLFFSAKEAFYKAQFPITETFLGFHDVEVHLDQGHFEIEMLTDASDVFIAGARFSGTYQKADTVWASAVILAN